MYLTTPDNCLSKEKAISVFILVSLLFSFYLEIKSEISKWKQETLWETYYHLSSLNRNWTKEGIFKLHPIIYLISATILSCNCKNQREKQEIKNNGTNWIRNASRALRYSCIKRREVLRTRINCGTCSKLTSGPMKWSIGEVNWLLPSLALSCETWKTRWIIKFGGRLSFYAISPICWITTNSQTSHKTSSWVFDVKLEPKISDQSVHWSLDVIPQFTYTKENFSLKMLATKAGIVQIEWTMSKMPMKKINILFSLKGLESVFWWGRQDWYN